MDEFDAGVDLRLEGSLPFGNIKNVYYVARKEGSQSDSVQSEILPASSLIQFDWKRLKKNETYIFSFYADITAGAMGTLTTKMKVIYYWTGTADQNNGDVTDEITGQTTAWVLYAAAPTVTSATLSLTAVVNNTFMELNKTTVTAPAAASIATKGIAWRTSFTNNSRSGVLRFDSLRLFYKGADVTGQWIFVDSLGASITSISEANAGSKKFFAVPITGPSGGEAETLPGTSDDFSIWGIARGFGGDSVISDVFSCVTLSDITVAPTGYLYLNKGTIGLNAKLYNSPTASSGAKVFHFIWSPKKYIPHSAAYGAACPDWYNGYGVAFNVTPTIFQSRIASSRRK